MGQPEGAVQELHLGRLQQVNILGSRGACIAGLAKTGPSFFILDGRKTEMTRFFEHGTVMAEMERQMTMTPNFAPGTPPPGLPQSALPLPLRAAGGRSGDPGGTYH